MCSEALLIARPTPHGHPVQSPTKYRTKFRQTRRLRVTARSRTARTNAAMSTSRSGTAAATRSGGAAALTAAATLVIVAVTAMSFGGVSPAHCERKHVSVTCVTLVATRAEMRTCGRARAGAPLRTSSLLPLRKALRALFRGWGPSKRRARPPAQERMPSRDSRQHAIAPITLQMFLALPARMHVLVSKQTHAKTIPYPETITGICGAGWDVLESKRGSPGSLKCHGAQPARQLHRRRRQSSLPLPMPKLGTAAG